MWQDVWMTPLSRLYQQSGKLIYFVQNIIPLRCQRGMLQNNTTIFHSFIHTVLAENLSFGKKLKSFA